MLVIVCNKFQNIPTYIFFHFRSRALILIPRKIGSCSQKLGIVKTCQTMPHDWLMSIARGITNMIHLTKRLWDAGIHSRSHKPWSFTSFANSVMDLQTLLHNLHEEVSCSVCMSPFTDPKILPCFHTFCLHCLNELQRTSGKHGEITCPECRRKFQVPGSGYPKDLPANFRMNSLLDVMAIQKCNVAGVKCGNCDKTRAQSFYCFKCCAFWCDDCIAAHNIIRANKDHRVLAIKDFQDQDIEDVLKRPVFCQIEHHESEELKFFCKNCENAICTEAQVQDNKDGSYNISYFAKEAGTCHTSVMVNGEHVSDSPFTVQVEPRKYKPVLSFGGDGSSTGMFNAPWGVAVNERNEIALTDSDNNRVQIFSSDGTYLRSFGSKGDQEGELIHPCGIAYLNNGNIVVADFGNHRLQIFTGQGEYLTKIGSKGNLDHEFVYPWGLSVDSDGNIIVADSNNKLIKIFTPSGQFLRKFGGEDLLVDPCHCIQKDQYFIVSDYGDHSIKVFNAYSDFLYKFGNEGEGDEEFDNPYCLSVDKAGHLMVCDGNNDRVQVLELNGKFITKFKLKSRGLPMSTAVLSDGRIVVSDFRDSRIQIIE